MTRFQAIGKRSLDILASGVGLVIFVIPIGLCWVIASIDTRKSGFFRQIRIGKSGIPFQVIKIRSVRDVKGVSTHVTTDKDPRISPVGRAFRKTKLDELPQLFNVLIGKMSLVGPRPDVPGYADRLKEEDRILLTLRPGITGPASLFFKYEEAMLAQASDAESYNDKVLWPVKTAINRSYLDEYTLWKDIGYVLTTVFGIGWKRLEQKYMPLLLEYQKKYDQETATEV